MFNYFRPLKQQVQLSLPAFYLCWASVSFPKTSFFSTVPTRLLSFSCEVIYCLISFSYGNRFSHCIYSLTSITTFESSQESLIPVSLHLIWAWPRPPAISDHIVLTSLTELRYQPPFSVHVDLLMRRSWRFLSESDIDTLSHFHSVSISGECSLQIMLHIMRPCCYRQPQKNRFLFCLREQEVTHMHTHSHTGCHMRADRTWYYSSGVFNRTTSSTSQLVLCDADRERVDTDPIAYSSSHTQLAA